MLAVRKTLQTEYQSEAARLPVAKVRKKAKAGKNPWGRYFFLVVIAVVVAISITGRYAAMARTNYEITRLKSSVAALEKEHEILQINIAALKAPGRVQEIAVSRLGMQLPEKVYYASTQPTGSTKPANTEVADTAAAPWVASKAEAHGMRR